MRKEREERPGWRRRRRAHRAQQRARYLSLFVSALSATPFLPSTATCRSVFDWNHVVCAVVNEERAPIVAAEGLKRVPTVYSRV